MYLLFFETDGQATRIRLLDILDKFTGHSYFVLNEEKNYLFLDCLSEGEIQLEKSIIYDIIKVPVLS